MIDYSSAILLLGGYILTGKRNKNGWILSTLGNIGYIYILSSTKYYGLLSLSIVMTFLCIYNFIKWNNEGKAK